MLAGSAAVRTGTGVDGVGLHSEPPRNVKTRRHPSWYAAFPSTEKRLLTASYNFYSLSSPESERKLQKALGGIETVYRSLERMGK